MFYIIETNKQLEKFNARGYKDVFIEIIPSTPFIHPSVNKISLIYIHPINAYKGYFLCLKHNETFSLDIQSITSTVESFDKIFVLNKKDFLFYFPLKNTHDISLNYPSYQKPISNIHEYYYNNFRDINNINEIIPISKHYEWYEDIFKDIKKYCYEPQKTIFSNKAPIVFGIIEKTGLRTNPTLLEDYFEIPNQEVVYSYYNWNTLTTRPSNNFGGINFMNLNKKDGSKRCFIPHNSEFLEVDISAYHPTLIAKMIGYDFKNKDIHQELADMYGVSYQESKLITFKIIYGGNYGEYKSLPFFQKLDEFVNKLWEDYNKNGYIKEDIGKYVFSKDQLENMNPFKLLNYLLQAKETANNINIIWDILKIIKPYKTKLVQYVYDSFVFDLHEDEHFLIDKIFHIFTQYNLNIKYKFSKTLNFD
jgi:hypothetical protein